MKEYQLVCFLQYCSISEIWKTTSLSRSVSSHKAFYTISLKISTWIYSHLKGNKHVFLFSISILLGQICVKPHNVCFLKYILSLQLPVYWDRFVLHFKKTQKISIFLITSLLGQIFVKLSPQQQIVPLVRESFPSPPAWSFVTTPGFVAVWCLLSFVCWHNNKYKLKSKCLILCHHTWVWWKAFKCISYHDMKR